MRDMIQSTLQWFAHAAGGDRLAILLAAIDTPGIARNMASVTPLASGGGDLNGSANAAQLLGQSGTAGRRISMPRRGGGNYTGIV
jgi:hypothetical protein